MFKQALGYLTIFKWPFNPMVSVDRDLGTPHFKMPRVNDTHDEISTL